MKSLGLQLAGWMFALPLGLGFIASFLDRLHLGELVTRMVLGYEAVSEAIWASLGFRVNSGSEIYSHLFATYVIISYAPAVLYIIMRKLFAYSANNNRDSEYFIWMSLSYFGMYVGLFALAPQLMLSIDMLVAILSASMILILIVRTNSHERSSDLVRRFGLKPGTLYNNQIKLVPFLAVSMLTLLQSLSSISLQGKDLIIISEVTTPLLMLTMLAISDGLRFHAKVFLVIIGIFIMDWVERTAVPGLSGFLDGIGA